MVTMSQPRITIRNALEHEARAMAEVHCRSYQGLEFWTACFASAEEESWIDSQADYCLQHIGDSNSLALVAEDEQGKIVGAALGRFLGCADAKHARKKPIAGASEDELKKMDNTPYRDSLIQSYGQILWICQFAVLPDSRRNGAGKALAMRMIDEAKARRVNVALAGTPEAKSFYQKRGFVEEGPFRLLAGGTIRGTNHMKLVLSSTVE